jgi:hypothetical protein
MVRRILWFGAALLGAQTATAQLPGGGGMGGMGGMGGGRRGGAGGMGGMGGGMERVGRAQNMKFPSAKALQDYNPASLLLEKHKKLKLTDAQQEQMKALRLMIFERNATLLARYDSMQREYKPPQLDGGALGGGSGGGFGGGVGGRGGARGGTRGQGGEGGQAQDPVADSTRRSAMREMMQLRQLADSLEDRRRTDVREVLSSLSDDAQKKKAAEFLDKQDIEFAKEFPAPPQQRGQRGPGDEGDPNGSGGGRGRPPV